MANKKAAGTDYIPQYETNPRKREYKPEQKKNKSKKSRNKNKNKNKKKLWLARVSPQIGLIALFFVICVSFVAQNVWLNGLGHEVVNLNQKIEDLQIHNEKLSLDIASLTSLEKIEESAAKIGMTYPNTSNFVYVEKPNKQEEDINIKYPQKENKEENFIDNVQSFISNSFNKVD